MPLLQSLRRAAGVLWQVKRKSTTAKCATTWAPLTWSRGALGRRLRSRCVVHAYRSWQASEPLQHARRVAVKLIHINETEGVREKCGEDKESQIIVVVVDYVKYTKRAILLIYIVRIILITPHLHFCTSSISLIVIEIFSMQLQEYLSLVHFMSLYIIINVVCLYY